MAFDIAKTAKACPEPIVAHAWFHTPNAEADDRPAGELPDFCAASAQAGEHQRHQIRNLSCRRTMQDTRGSRGFAMLEKYGLSGLRVPMGHSSRRSGCDRQFPKKHRSCSTTRLPLDRARKGSRMAQGDGRPSRAAQSASQGLRLRTRDQPWATHPTAASCATPLPYSASKRCRSPANFPVAGLRVEADTLVSAVQRMIGDLFWARIRRVPLEECSRVLSAERIVRPRANAFSNGSEHDRSPEVSACRDPSAVALPCSQCRPTACSR